MGNIYEGMYDQYLLDDTNKAKEDCAKFLKEQTPYESQHYASIVEIDYETGTMTVMYLQEGNTVKVDKTN
jgi:hypothetical protein